MWVKIKEDLFNLDRIEVIYKSGFNEIILIFNCRVIETERYKNIQFDTEKERNIEFERIEKLLIEKE